MFTIDKLNKVMLFIDCHTVIIWTLITSGFYNKGYYLYALLTSVATAWFLYLMATRLIVRYVNAMIAGIIAGAEYIREQESTSKE